MKTRGIIGFFFAFVLCAFVAHGQTGIRFGDGQPIWSVAPVGLNILVVSNAGVQFCNAPANAVPCTNYATTYSDNTLGTPCMSTTQIVLAGTSTCVAKPDMYGNWGVWLSCSSVQQYAYTVTVGSNSYGPYPVTPCGTGSGASPTGNVGDAQCKLTSSTFSACHLNDTGTALVAGEPLTGPEINGTLDIDGNTYTSLAAAFAAVPSRGTTVHVPPGYSQTITSTLVFPPRTHLVFDGPLSSLTCNTGATDCIQFSGEGDSIDGFCPDLAGFNGTSQCSTITNGTTTGDVIHIAWGTPANITDSSVKNIAINMAGESNTAVNCTSCWFADFDSLYIYNIGGTGIYLQDDQVGSTNRLTARYLTFTNVYLVQSAGALPAIVFDSTNGSGISEVTATNFHTEGNGGGQRALFIAGGAPYNGQNSQMRFIGWHMFNDTTSQYAVEFRAQSGSSYTGSGGVNAGMVFTDFGLENISATAPAVPGFACTEYNGSAYVLNGAGCGGLLFDEAGASGYQLTAWPDGFDYAALGYGSEVNESNGGSNVLGYSMVSNLGIHTYGLSDIGTTGSNNNFDDVLLLDKTSTLTPAANIGEDINYRISNSAANIINSVRLLGSLTTATAGSEVSEFDIYTLGGGTLSRSVSIAGAGISFAPPLVDTNPGGITSPIFNAIAGYQYNGAAPSGHCLIGNGTDYIDSSTCGGSGGSAFSGGLGASYQDVTEIAAPSNPASGNDRLFLNLITHLLDCHTSSGSTCMPSTGSGANTALSNLVSPAINTSLGTVPFGRLVMSGTSLSSGDFAIGGGWGSTASLTVIGTDEGFAVTITSTGTGQTINPTITLTFHDGAWANPPVFTCAQSGGTGTRADIDQTPTTTQIPMTWDSTPVAGLTYKINCIGLGR